VQPRTQNEKLKPTMFGSDPIVQPVEVPVMNKSLVSSPETLLGKSINQIWSSAFE
jgi:hypothetical protein